MSEVNEYVARDWLIEKRRECREKESFEEVEILNLVMNELDNLVKLRFHLEGFAGILENAQVKDDKPNYANILRSWLDKFSMKEVQDE